MTLSIPDAGFDEAFGIFPTLGTVSSRTIATEDLTDKLVDADARLKNLRREENDLRHIMDRSGKMREMSSTSSSNSRPCATRSRRSAELVPIRESRVADRV